MASSSRRYRRVRRSSGGQTRSFQIGSATVQVSADTPIVMINGCQIALTPCESLLFQALLDQPSRIVLTSALLARCRTPGRVNRVQNVERHLRSVRRKLRESGIRELSLVRVVSYGYVLLPLPSPDHPVSDRQFA